MVIKNPICSICNTKEEAVEHMLLLYEWIKGCWFERCHGIKIDKMTLSSFDRWFLEVIKDLKRSGAKNVLNDVVYVC